MAVISSCRNLNDDSCHYRLPYGTSSLSAITSAPEPRKCHQVKQISSEFLFCFMLPAWACFEGLGLGFAQSLCNFIRARSSYFSSCAPAEREIKNIQMLKGYITGWNRFYPTPLISNMLEL